MKKTSLLIAGSFVCVALVCLISATTVLGGLSAEQKRELKKCAHTYDTCVKNCPDNELSQGRNQPGSCRKACLDQYYICRQKAGIPPWAPPQTPYGSLGPTAPPSKSAPLVTPTPTPDHTITKNPGHGGPLKPLPTPTPTR